VKNNILEIIVSADHQLTFESPTGVVDSGILIDVGQVISQMLREAPVPLPKPDNGQMQPVKEVVA